MRRTVNWRFLLKVALALALVGAAVHFAHRRQVTRQTDVYLRHADTARDAGDHPREIAFLRRYLTVRPADHDARERLARVMCRTAKGPSQLAEAYLVLEDALRRAPDRDELRRYAVDVALDPRVQLFADARGHLDVLLHKRPGDGELEGLYALCLSREGRYQTEGTTRGAADWYAESIQHRPDLVESYVGRASILRLRLNQTNEAHQVIADMLTANPANFRAHLYAAEYWRALNKPRESAVRVAKPVAEAQALPPDALVDDAITAAVARAEACAPQELSVLLFAADIARARTGKDKDAGEAKARQLLARATELHPKAPSVYLALADLEADTRTPADGLAVIRKGLSALPGSVDLSLALVDYQIRAGDAAGAEETLQQLRAGLPPALGDYQQARILALRERWLDAALLLENVRPETVGDPALARRVNFLLGRCYAQIGEHDRRLEAYTRAAPADPADPLWVLAMAGIAETHAALGRSDDALAVYRRLKDYAPGAWVPVARFELLRALRSPADKRDWRPADEALAAAESAFKDTPADRVPTDLHLVRADLLNLEGKPDEARKVLDDLRAKRPKEIAVWVALARQELLASKPELAAAALDAGAKEAGDSPELRLARARLWVEVKPPDLPAKLATLAADADTFPAGQRHQLFRDLAPIATAAGADDLAGRLWDRAVEVRKDDLGAHLIRFDRALRAGADTEKIRDEIRRVDGEAGSFTRLTRAAVLIRAAQTRNELGGLDEALALLSELARERPRWSRVVLGQALVYDLRGNPDAIIKYREAVEYGETGPETLRRLLTLLHARGRFGEAAAILQKLEEEAAAGPDAQRLAAEVHLRTDNPKAAIVAAVKAVPADSQKPDDHLWLGQVYWATGDRNKAEVALRRAVELAPSEANGWRVLIRFLVVTGRKEEAAKTLARATDQVAKADRALFIALGQVELGQADKAAEAFRAARAERPDDLRTVQAEADFLFQAGKLPEAQEAFARVIGMQSASPEEKDFARQMIAVALAADRDYQTSRKALEALGLVDRAIGPGATETPTQRRFRAIALALQRDRASKLEAIRLLEETRSALTLPDLFFLAQLHLAVGNRAQVQVVMADLLQRPNATKVPLYLAFHAAWLLKQGDVREAEKWVKRLEELQPDALQTAELVARLFVAKKDPAAARAVLRAKADPPGAPVGPLARVCEDIGLFEDAERLLKRFVAETQMARPQAPLALAAFYGRRGRTAEGLRVCEAVPAAVPVPVVGEIAVGILYAAPDPGPDNIAKVARWLETAAAKEPGPVRAALLQLLASVRNLQGDYAAAANLYRQALAIDARDALAMNNLAFLLSTREGTHDDALKLLDQAKKILGPVPDLLDTEAIVRLRKGEVAAARALLEEVLAVAPSAVGYFHLAQVEHKAERTLDAKLAWRRAEDLGLRPADLHPLEREAYTQLARVLK